MTHTKCGGVLRRIPDPAYLVELKSKPYAFKYVPHAYACDRCGLRGEVFDVGYEVEPEDHRP